MVSKQFEIRTSGDKQKRGSFIFCQKEGVKVFFFSNLCGQHPSAAYGGDILFFPPAVCHPDAPFWDPLVKQLNL
jgi:hypothetical protein